MRRILLIIITTSILLLSCARENQYNEIKTVILTGNIHNYNGNNAKLYLLYSIPGSKEIRDTIHVNNSGYFEYKFSCYIPLDAMILEKRTFANINFIYHPGDSIHVEFVAQEKQKDLLNSVIFSGDRSFTNNDLIKFQRLREDNNLGFGAIDTKRAYKLNANDFVPEMEKIREKQIALYDKFVKDFNPNSETRSWTAIFATETYYYFLDDYCYEKKIELPGQSLNFIESISPLTINKLICWKILNQRISRYRSAKIESAFEKKHSCIMGKIKSGDISPDSLLIDFFRNSSSDSLLNQLLIANYYVNEFDGNIIDGYEKNINAIHKVINEPFIFNPLNDNYKQVNDFINRPEIMTNEILIKIEGTPIKETFSKILSKNTGKVIYLDCWATWCGPCKEAMPDSKKLMTKLKDKDVAFVYVCIESEEKIWKRLVAEFDLDGGQHFLMNKQQSEFFRDILKIGGVPCYFLINSKGQIVEQGFNLHPGERETEEKIIRLLSET